MEEAEGLARMGSEVTEVGGGSGVAGAQAGGVLTEG